MRREEHSLLLMDGSIKRIRYEKESAFLDFKHPQEGDMTVEFRNAKKNRADHVRKLRLNATEKVILVGSKSSSTPCYLFGYDVERRGWLSTGNYSLLKGPVQSLMKIGCSIVAGIAVEGSKNTSIKIPDSILKKDIQMEDEITCICLRTSEEFCKKPCKEWGISKCSSCKKKQQVPHYLALECSVQSQKG